MKAELESRRQGPLGILTLNRPKALHSLNLGMCEAMAATLLEWRGDPAVEVVLIEHAHGTRGFCAGGDVVSVRKSVLEDDGALGRAFFTAEYRLNHLLYTFPKPVVAFMDGVTMGGGVGIGMPARYRVATENTLFAMPEGAIGLFPDVGAGLYLSRLSGHLGKFLALTAARLDGAECLWAGLATHYLAADDLAEAREAIAREPQATGDILKDLSSPPPPAPDPPPAAGSRSHPHHARGRCRGEKPVMLYSIGKDSAVMLHLARKAFYPAPPPFPLLHVDTTWKFKDMYALREKMRARCGMELLVYQNPEAQELGINPFDHGPLHTDMWKTEGLKQALDLYGFDAAFGGARRDEEKSRAKERIFSFRTASHGWDPKNQRPELWNLYNARKNKGESIRVFPISNWTELDIWQYIMADEHRDRAALFLRPAPDL
jgi:enoyl-CoA hydratase/carnithine racemase